MKVGLFINTQFPESFNLAERVPEMVAQVRAARDRVRFALVPASLADPSDADAADHACHGLRRGARTGHDDRAEHPDPAAAQPHACGREAATLDVLTGSNYILGVGLGYRQPEFDAFGISLRERAPRFDETSL